MRNIILLALMAGVLTGCYTVSEADYVKQMNANWRVWPPVVEGQAFPVQTMGDQSRHLWLALSVLTRRSSVLQSPPPAL